MQAAMLSPRFKVKEYQVLEATLRLGCADAVFEAVLADDYAYEDCLNKERSLNEFNFLIAVSIGAFFFSDKVFSISPISSIASVYSFIALA